MTTVRYPRRPRIDIASDGPMKFHGFRVGRDGGIYATTTPTRHGRTNPNYETLIGSVERIGAPRRYVGRTLSGCTGSFQTQTEDTNLVYRAAQKQQDDLR